MADIKGLMYLRDRLEIDKMAAITRVEIYGCFETVSKREKIWLSGFDILEGNFLAVILLYPFRKIG